MLHYFLVDLVAVGPLHYDLVDIISYENKLCSYVRSSAHMPSPNGCAHM